MHDGETRPKRLSVHNELGQTHSLADCRESFARMGEQRGPALFLGLGPSPWRIPTFVPQAWDKSFYVECPACEAQMPAHWREGIPAHFQPIPARVVLEGGWPGPVFFYLPGLKHFPSFWGPLWAKIRVDDIRAKARDHRSAHPSPAARTVILPGTERGLLVPEISQAFVEAGFSVMVMDPARTLEDIPGLLAQGRPDLFFSVNFQGLDEYGRVFHLLRAAGVAVAAWCVDNPFHLLTGQKNLLWKRLPLFVTDDWFIGPLRSLGADARHLPLAVSPKFFAPGAACPSGRDLTFVGRSSFPDRDRFFAACRIPESLIREAEDLPGRQAHFGWWRDKLPDIPLWPGNDVRALGLGAETASAAWRRNCLTALAAATDLTVIGDDAWRSLVPGVRLLPPVDYYAGLADACRRASFTLNLTSLLLPHGLTQRHFDVWACGGFLLTDDTPGLSIFPPDLTRPVTFETPEQAADLPAALAAAPKRKDELRRAWQEHILAEHNYVRRLEVLLDAIRV
ncbi:MAG TPA: glycosyl transferase family 1 [Desulfomicrobium sp.]|nr:glycosyl transferase family 1 [Desulfomicrobium sp.]